MHRIEAPWSLSGIYTDADFFTGQTDDRQTDKTDCLTPLCTCAHGVIPLWEAFKGHIERLDIKWHI